MSISNEFNDLIQKRKSIKSDVDYSHNPIIKNMVNLMTKNTRETIDFIVNDCTEEQFIWLSEIFDEIIEKTKNDEILDALRQTAQKYPKATQKYNINYFIDSAAEYLE